MGLWIVYQSSIANGMGKRKLRVAAGTILP
jgi:hypothetical protein